MIYFDNAATTKPFAESLDALKLAEDEFYANPSSTHPLGKAARAFVESRRRLVAEALDIDTGHYNVIFTANATQSNELMLQSLLKRPSGNALVGAGEHKSIEANAAILKLHGRIMHRAKTPKGFADEDAFLGAIEKDSKIKLVSLMQTNNVTGSVSDIYSIASSIKKRYPSVVFHSDCVQSLNMGLIDFAKARDSGIDAMSFSSHKSYAPKGLGLLVIKKGLEPSLSKGGGQERGIRPGTEPLGLMAAYADALGRLSGMRGEAKERFSRLRALFLDLIRALPSYRALRDGTGEYSDGIIAICSDRLPSEVLQRALGDEGIMVSVTSACASNAMKGSDNKIAALGYDAATARNTIRISFGIHNTEDEVRECVEALGRIAKKN